MQQSLLATGGDERWYDPRHKSLFGFLFEEFIMIDSAA